MKLSIKGEKQAALLFKKKGFRIICRNHTSRIGEIDIVAKKGPLLVFCEVKTRNSLEYGQPFEAVNNYKQKKIKKLAEQFIAGRDIKFDEIRFDVISILVNQNKLNHIENAF